MKYERKILGLVFCTVIMAIVLFTVNATAQTLQWERFWGGSGDEWGSGIFVSGGNIYVSGSTTSFDAGQEDLVVLKCDLFGNVICDKTVGGASLDIGRKVYVMDSNIYVAGVTWSIWQNAVILKFDSNCKPLWYRVWGCPYYPGGYDNMNDLFVIGDDIYCVGDTEFGWGNPRLLLQRYDTEGNLKWTSFWGPIGYNVHTISRGITVSGSDIYIAGYMESEPGDYHPWDALIMRYDTSGNLIWSKTWGGTGHEFAHGISVLGNDVYVVGYTNSYGAGEYDIFLLKYDSEGNFKWYKTFGGSEEDLGYDICISNDHLYVAGTTKSFGAGGNDAVTLKTDLSGNPIWYETWGGSAEDIAHSLHVLGNEIYIVGDTTSFGAGGRDVFLLKYTELITATIDIDPDTLNLRSKGKLITCYIELPEGYYVGEIDVGTILLEGVISAESKPTKIGDYDEDEVPDLMVKFDRAAVIEYIRDFLEITDGEDTLTVTGKVTGTSFEGSDTIRVISKGK